MLAVAIFVMAGIQQGQAQEMLIRQAADSLKTILSNDSLQKVVTDSLKSILGTDSLKSILGTDSLVVDEHLLENDQLNDVINQKVSQLVDSTLMPKPAKPIKDMNLWRPDPKRALWLALVIPGGGQIYNRKYWKLPIVYGGFMGCIYAMNWNNMMYKDYSQAYLDLTDNDPNTQSYNQFLHLGAQITDQNKSRYEDIFRKRKDRFRRYRDLSFFILVGVYALSVIDAYVDAELSVFDSSKDLSLKVEPAILNNHSSSNLLDNSSVGLQCSLNF